VPWFLRKPFDDGSGDYRVLIAALVHDMLYDTQWFTRDFADKLFHGMLKAPIISPDRPRGKGMGATKARMYYQAVHWFGGGPWNRHLETMEAREQIVKDRLLCPCPVWGDRMGLRDATESTMRI
jgi:hypothetical protein